MKTRYGVLGLNAKTVYRDCSSAKGNEVNSVLKDFHNEGIVFPLIETLMSMFLFVSVSITNKHVRVILMKSLNMNYKSVKAIYCTVLRMFLNEFFKLEVLLLPRPVLSES